MIQGTTPTHIFKLPIDTAEIREVMIIYAQNGAEVLTKYADDCEFEGNIVRCTLSQEDTFAFNPRQNVKVQFRALTENGTALASAPKVIDVVECLNNEVI